MPKSELRPRSMCNSEKCEDQYTKIWSERVVKYSVLACSHASIEIARQADAQLLRVIDHLVTWAALTYI